MMDSQLERLKERFAQMEDEDLLQIVGKEASDYRPEALELAREEIRRRGLQTNRPLTTQAAAPTPSQEGEEALDVGEAIEPTEEVEEPQSDWVTCAVCGGRLRNAILLGEHPIIAVFDDNREARYVKVLVCARCGNASLFVDLHTEVTE